MTIPHSLANLTPELLVRLFEATLKSSLILLVACSASFFLRGRSAALRHAIWTAGTAAGIAILFLPAIVPAWRILPTDLLVLSTRTSASEAKPSEVRAPAIAIGQGTDLPRHSAPKSAANKSKAASEEAVTMPSEYNAVIEAGKESRNIPQIPSFPWKLGLLSLWSLGVICCSVYYLAGALQLRRLLRKSIAVRNPAWNREVELCASQLAIRRHIVLLYSDHTEVPLTFGTFHPKIVLPADAEEWSSKRRHVVVQHELAHIARLDALTQTICHIGSVLYWFNPLMWLAARSIRLERERACDDYVLEAGISPSEYANDLLTMVSSFRNSDHYRVALAMARPSQFEGRLVALLNPKIDRRHISRGFALFTALIAALLVLPLAALAPARPAAQSVAPAAPSVMAVSGVAPAPETRKTDGGDSSPAPEALATTASSPEIVESISEAPVGLQDAPTPPPTPVAESAGPRRKTVAVIPPPDKQTGFECGTKVDSTSQVSSHTGDNDQFQTWKASWSSNGCSAILNSQGEITFNSDFTDFQKISPGGFVEIYTSINGEKRRLSVRPSTNGALEYVWLINDSTRNFDQDGHAWLARFLVAVDRQSAHGLNQRLPKLMQEGGPRRVLEEASYMSSDYARAQYLLKLIQSAELSSSDLQLTLARAGEMSSDYECARILMAVAGKYPLNEPATRSAFLSAIGSIHSDYEHARILMVFFEKGEIPIDMAKSVLESASRIHSDYEHARVLVEMANRKLVDARIQNDFLKSVNAIQSDYEHARTLVAFFEVRKSDDAAILGIIQSVPKIKSDYEASRVLSTIASSRRIDGSLRDEYVKAAQGIRSEHERSQALNAIGYRPATL